ncbi:SCP2 sterol-binding domain-containing protein [Phytohalomonas tamaricis]|uniref:SCP2 sterol-binding domain-containing protein n=1 Tax=Phytohalomonas tamaricis TaxID=2081032 RepID=UPI000D0B383E|nr:SCP2 sterol-binding domain-containing protein [Phytohalomonas tamaricis]
MTSREDLLEKLKDHFDPQASKGMQAIYQFDITDGDNYYLVINDGTMEIHEGNHHEPSITLSADKQTLKGVMEGNISGMGAFMSGRLKATGNVMLATQLSKLFKR